MTAKGTDYCMLVNEWAWLRSMGHAFAYLMLEVDLVSVLESELGEKWRYGAPKACLW